jgi:hypothetical protein
MPIKSKKNSPSIKKEISNYILKKGDICCEDDFDRDKVIEQIFSVYQEMFSNTYLDTLNNDMMLFIGYFIDLKKTNDKKGMKLWNYLEGQMPSTKNKTKDEKNIKKLLKSLPLFYLLSFLGMSHYKKHLN